MSTKLATQLTAVSLLFLCTLQEADGQTSSAHNKTARNQSSPGQAMKKAPPPDRSEFKESKLLQEFPSLPDWPTYTGKSKLVFCREFPNGGPGSYMIMYEAQENATHVAEWYQTALKSYKWKISKASERAIEARGPNGNGCKISITKANSKLIKSRVTIFYYKAS